MINEPNDVIVKEQAALPATPATIRHTIRHKTPDPHHPSASDRVALFGGTILVVLAFAGAGIVTQMSGCCGSAPTHGCRFVETIDAHLDMSSDMMLPCGTQICEPGVTTCCLEAESEPPIRCIPVGQVCNGPSASCSGDQDCPFGSGQHCCGNLETMMVNCQAECSGDYTKDSTLRVCRIDAECPPERPKCSTVSISGQTFFICKPTS
jgi:hypothetical protein